MLTSCDPFTSRIYGHSQKRARCTMFRLVGLPLLAIIVACSVIAFQPAAAQVAQAAHDEYPHCISHLWAVGSQLGWAEGIARHDAQSEDARMLEYMHTAGVQVKLANEMCAQRPAPWPAWQNWLEIQNRLAELADNFRDGRQNRTQLAIALAFMHQSLATQLAIRIVGGRLEHDTTCVDIYVRLAVALGFAQTTTEILHHLAPDAAVRLRQSVSLIYQMREMPQPCRDFKGLIPAIGEALNNPSDPSIVGRVDDIWHAGEAASAPRTE